MTDPDDDDSLPLPQGFSDVSLLESGILRRLFLKANDDSRRPTRNLERESLQTKEKMENMRKQILLNPRKVVREKNLEIIESWISEAFSNSGRNRPRRGDQDMHRMFIEYFWRLWQCGAALPSVAKTQGDATNDALAWLNKKRSSMGCTTFMGGPTVKTEEAPMALSTPPGQRHRGRPKTTVNKVTSDRPSHSLSSPPIEPTAPSLSAEVNLSASTKRRPKREVPAHSPLKDRDVKPKLEPNSSLSVGASMTVSTERKPKREAASSLPMVPRKRKRVADDTSPHPDVAPTKRPKTGCDILPVSSASVPKHGVAPVESHSSVGVPQSPCIPVLVASSDTPTALGVASGIPLTATLIDFVPLCAQTTTPAALPGRPDTAQEHIVVDQTAPMQVETVVSSSSSQKQSQGTAKQLMSLDSNCVTPTSRDACPDFPPIWAQSRQEVCEAFDRFRSYQGGVYFSEGIAKGYFLSKFSSLRDGWFQDGKIIISHGGGKAESTSQSKGKLRTNAASDQEEDDKSVSALLNTYRRKEPLVLLIDDNYKYFPFDLRTKKFSYVVLGFYFISHVWNEYQPASTEQGYVVRYKFAFQWCAGQAEPWWLKPEQWPKESAPEACHLDIHSQPSLEQPPPNDKQRKKRRDPVKKKGETAVNHDSVTIIHETPNLFSECAECKKRSPQVYEYAWMCLRASCPNFWTCELSHPLPNQLAYNLTFLDLLENPVHLPSTISIYPSRPVQVETEGKELVATHYSFSRGWHCRRCGRLSCRFRWSRWECMQCDNSWMVPIKIQARNELYKPGGMKSDNQVNKSSGILNEGVKTIMQGAGFFQTWTLPGDIGQIHRIRPKIMIAADKIFQAYQEQAKTGDLDFRRWPMRRHKCRGNLLTHYFSHNCGEPYDYVGGTQNTVSWDDAPSAVKDARDMIEERLRQALNITDYHFNEVLSAAYMEDQSMAFHSDSEQGLDRIVAGLSLGSSAKMHFRPVVTGGGKREIALTVILEHGDVLVMAGAAIQERYEHTVVPDGFRIAATARRINPREHLPEGGRTTQVKKEVKNEEG